MKVFREEFFGGVLYDAQTLSYQLVYDAAEGRRQADRVLPQTEAPARRDILSGPVSVYFEITQRCNLACRQCFVSSHPAQPLGMDMATIRGVLEDMQRARVINVRFTGGEPTIRPDWYEVLSYAKELGFVVALNTNGVFADPADTIDKIESLGLEQLTVSLDGLEAAHDHYRGKGAFQKTVDALAEIRRRGIHTRITTTLTRRNVDDIAGLVVLARQHVDVINFVCLRPVGRGVKVKDTALSFDEHLQSAMVVKALQQQSSDLLILHSDLPLPDRMTIRPDARGGGIEAAAGFASTCLNIGADGTVWPHHYSGHQTDRFQMGRYPDDRMLDIWHGSARLDGFRAWTQALQDRCGGCPEQHVRCAGINFEMEVARQLGLAADNPSCVNEAPVPAFQAMMP
jgi:MoaA/NifB/PqqE/SkfB family radical SAM enzyme